MQRSSKFYGFHAFANPGYPIRPSGPFRDNIRTYLRECAGIEDYTVEGMPVWCTSLVHENRGFVLPLYTIEESVEHSTQPFCDECRSTGWNHHLVSKRKYHMIIPVDDEWNRPLSDDVFDLNTHLLHGLIHCNGFGHLLCVNGIEGGSKSLTGREIMDLWDRICTNLRARKITVEDLSKKRQMDLRLLHGVAYGHPWFGRWGYNFCHGSFGVTEHSYERAIEILSSLELKTVVSDFNSTQRYREINEIIRCYRDSSETRLLTVQDLLRFMLALKSHLPGTKLNSSTTITQFQCSSRPLVRKDLHIKPAEKEKTVKCRKFSTVAANLDSRWPIRRLEYAADVIVEALKEKKAANTYSNGGMTRQEARDAARLHIGDTGLIDYVLKSMNNVIVGGFLVRRAVNRSTRVLEYTIQEFKNGFNDDSEVEIVTEPVKPLGLVPGIDVYSDVSFVYNNVLLDYPKSGAIQSAVRTILDSKHFVKEWPFMDQEDPMLRFICRVVPFCSDFEFEMKVEFLPKEHVLVPLHATVCDLKMAAQTALRDTYCVMDQLMVTEIEELEEMEDGEVLFGAVESGSELCLRVVGIDRRSELRYEGGSDNWTVRCKCGAQDDDGERMVACDVCGIWQHTRCAGIEDNEVVPPLFACSGCCASLAPPPRTNDFFDYGCHEDLIFDPIHEFDVYLSHANTIV